jgi:hypothetical protein
MVSGGMADRRQRITPKKGGRFDPDEVATRLERLRALAGVGPKDVGSAIWPKQSADNAARSWYRRTSSRLNDFNLGEIEAAVDYLAPKAHSAGKIKGLHLPGFPFIDLWVAEKLETQ